MKAELREATIAQKITPVMCGSAFKNKGVQPLLDAVVDYLPSPVDIPPVKGVNPDDESFTERKALDDEPFAALVFKIMTDPFVGQLAFFRVYSGHVASGTAVLNTTKGNTERIGRLLKMHANKREEIKEVWAGDIGAAVGLRSVTTGDTICDKDDAIVLETMSFPEPQVAYREAITRSADAHGRFVRQSGGKGQYGDVKIRIEPNKEKDYEFVNDIVGGSIPKEFIKPTDQGIREAMEKGILAGYPMTGIKVTLYDGSYHDVDSSEMAFKIAGSMAFQEAARKAGPILKEPIMDVEAVTPEEYAGDVMGDLSRRRGKIQQMDERGGAKVIRAHVPLSEMFGYATQVRSMSQGRASYTMQFYLYDPAPKSVADEVIAKVAG